MLLVGFVTPDEGCQRALPFDQFPGQPSLIPDCLDFAVMADDAFVFEQTIEVALGEARYPVDVKITERSAKTLTLGEDGAPTQFELKTLQTQFLA